MSFQIPRFHPIFHFMVSQFLGSPSFSDVLFIYGGFQNFEKYWLGKL